MAATTNNVVIDPNDSQFLQTLKAMYNRHGGTDNGKMGSDTFNSATPNNPLYRKDQDFAITYLANEALNDMNATDHSDYINEGNFVGPIPDWQFSGNGLRYDDPNRTNDPEFIGSEEEGNWNTNEILNYTLENHPERLESPYWESVASELNWRPAGYIWGFADLLKKMREGTTPAQQNASSGAWQDLQAKNKAD